MEIVIVMSKFCVFHRNDDYYSFFPEGQDIISDNGCKKILSNFFSILFLRCKMSWDVLDYFIIDFQFYIYVE